ncbi:uncharacterized protein LOC131432047 [Malaya genurostris]|uniref:uncharacterized protein LOC131432047 n=1 Tax=Malaya genurostris TaxID=325434 RepID=UPI0026F40153|nr:uncharacterized protein LOC131432047 [Malaya genurostris]
MALLIGLVLCWIVSCSVAAPTVHLIKPENNEYIPESPSYIQTDSPQLVDPIWMTVTMKPLVKTTVVEPINKSDQPSLETVSQSTAPQQPSYYPYYHQLQTVPNLQQPYPYNTPQYQYQPGFPFQWSSLAAQPLVAQPLLASQLYPFPLQQLSGGLTSSSSSNAQPCDDGGRNIGGYQQHGY